ncbi:beta-hexosaminidase [Psychromonas sp. psych-6C06]|uniref:beta-N-acetylhexosaminidase n=1 Tax=Psychromonas sp. psych-6C06 TaxID=2058089 RepID=UPI000C33DD0A|nr:beta-N-acetylhexosaminidase [Psychromonas sp. psych-6C06]PKF62845.1 beta-hexosaminidase [Psychromonas sp. psych-6C06]
MKNFSLDIAVLNSKDNLIQLTLHNLTDAPLQDWLLTLDFARFIFPESMSKGHVEQIGTFTKITPSENEVIKAGDYYQITFTIKSAPFTNYECGVREGYISSAQDNFVTHHPLSVSQITLQLPDVKPVDKITTKAADISLIPKVNQLTVQQGQFQLADMLAFTVSCEQAKLASHWLVDELRYAAQLTPATSCDANLEFNFAKSLQAGEYKLTVSDTAIDIEASSESGFIHAVASLLQLVKTDSEGQYFLSCVEVKDKPRFDYRGLMLDCSRHFHSIATVKRLINQMAHFKLNHFHWHFTDDEGWRLEINAFPQLTDIGAWRGPGTALEAQFSHLTEKYGGYYRQAEVKEVIEYAAKRGITVVPEIDIPGHCRAAIKSLPELLVDTDDKSEYRSIQAYTDNVLSPALEGTYQFLDAVIDEVCALFPSPYIHIGADEVPKGVWEKSAKCQALMKAHGYSEEMELQGHLLRHVENRIKSNGKRMFGWEEVKFGDKVSKNTVIFSWISEEAALECVNRGFDVVMQPSKYTYFDIVQDFAPEELGVDWAGTLPLEQAYGYEPLADLKSDDPLREHIMGVQCALWSEVVLTQDRIDHMFFPRLLATAEVAWSATQDKNWGDFCARLQAQKPYFERNKINYRKF